MLPKYRVIVTYRNPDGSQRQQTYNAETLFQAMGCVTDQTKKANAKRVELVMTLETWEKST